MGQELIKREYPAPTPQIAKGLSQQELFAHRDRIYSEVLAVLSAYFQPSDSPEIRAINKAWWCDELQDWTQDQVVYAMRKWNRDYPRLRPTPGDIVKLLKLLRGMREAERMQAKRQAEPEPCGDRVTAERAAEILREAGIGMRP